MLKRGKLGVPAILVTPRLAACALALLAILAVATAAGATGDLIPKGCFQDDTGTDACATTLDSLGGAVSVTVSGDGRSVYGVARDDSAIETFKRNRSSGALTPLGCVANAGFSPTCAKHTKGLFEPFQLALSPDDRFAYVAARDGAIVIFKRDHQTGKLKSKGCVEDKNIDLGCAQKAQGIGGAISLAISADGRSLYAVGVSDEAVALFRRNLKTGSLNGMGCVSDHDSGAPGCARRHGGLGDPLAIAVSSDGRSVYATSLSDNAIVRFHRNLKTGSLLAKSCVEDEDVGPDDCAATAPGLEGATGVAVSSDGKSVYVTGSSDETVVTFHRAKHSGALSGASCIDDNDTGPGTCAQSADGLRDANSITLGPEGKTAYVAGEFDHAISIFKRNKSSGALTPTSCIADNDDNPEPCFQAADGMRVLAATAISSDGKSLYSAAFSDDAIARFKRTP
jgi:6-phosphogluconolactonase (cycloisomerase 2 family)